MTRLTGILVFLMCLAASQPMAAAGELTSEQARELSLLKRKLSHVSTLTRRRKFDEAREALDNIETQLNAIADEANLKLDSRELASTHKTLVRQRHVVAMREDPKGYRDAQNSVSFVKHIVPILKSRCIRCHADDPQGRLRLDSFAGMKQGGKSGPLLATGNAGRSLIMYRLAAPEQHRMPQQAAPLLPNELSLMALWINQGANFDGADEQHDLDELLNPRNVEPPKVFPKPDGSETVSFRNDIAPFIVEYCLRCHQGKKPSGELLLADFESMMRGGRHGRVIIPGDPQNSLLYQLMASFDEASRMPLEGRVTRKHFDDMTTWIREGAKYDADNSRLHLRALNPGNSEMKAAELASMTQEQLKQFREARSMAQWQKVFPNSECRSAMSAEIICYGNVTTGRLTQLHAWADAHLSTLRELFDLKPDRPVWRGRLAVFVLADRADFETFSQENARQRVFREDHGITKVSPTFEDAFVVLHDTGDKSDKTTPTLQFSLIQQLTTAYLATVETGYPEWITEGLGPALAAEEADDRDAFVDSFRAAVVDSLSDLETPADVFHDGIFFSPEQARPVAMTLTQFLLKRARIQNLSRLLKALDDGVNIDNSIRVVYGAEPELIARAYLSALKIKRR